MAQFSVNPTRFDPYKNFKFRVKRDGQFIPGVDRISALRRETEVLAHREGGEPSTDRRSPGSTTYEPIVLSRGRTHDTAFEAWANKVWDYGAGLGSEVSLKDFRKDVILEVYNEAGQLAIAYTLYRCWPSEFQAQADLDANTGGILFQHLKLEHEGFDLDISVPELPEPSFVIPSGA